jgi:hypothetical protein
LAPEALFFFCEFQSDGVSEVLLGGVWKEFGDPLIPFDESSSDRFLRLEGPTGKGWHSVLKTSVERSRSLDSRRRMNKKGEKESLTFIQRVPLRIIESEIKILQRLREEETLRIIQESSTGSIKRINVPDPGKRSIHTEHLVKRAQRLLRPIEVDSLPRCTICVEVRFEDFWTEDVIRCALENVESVFVVEECVRKRGAVATSEATILGYEAEGFRADLGSEKPDQRSILNAITGWECVGIEECVVKEAN